MSATSNILKTALWSAAAAVLVAGTDSAAQSVDPIQQCRETSADKDARIACLETAITDLTGQKRAAPAGGETSASPAAAAAAEEDAGAAEAAGGLGAEQVAKRTKDEKGFLAKSKGEKADDALNANIVEYAYTGLGDVIFFLDNGQIWRQKQADSQRIRLRKRKAYTVTISRGLVSGYRLRINEIKRTLLVERIK